MPDGSYDPHRGRGLWGDEHSDEASTPAPMCTKPPSSQAFIGPAPTPTPTPTPIPTLSAEDVAHGLCEAADAVDPLSPDPATIDGPDIGDLIDQAYALLLPRRSKKGLLLW